jgi:Mn-dependent DtxR family transcriptional regulator
MERPRIKYTWSDSWLLLAIYGATLSNKTAKLSDIIAIGDYINHAIFTTSELNGGLSRLHRGKLIKISKDKYSLTKRGKEIAEPDPKTKKRVWDQLETIKVRLFWEKQKDQQKIFVRTGTNTWAMGN